MPDIVLETERLILRTAEEGDGELLYRHLNSAKLKKHIGGPASLVELEQRVARIMAAQARDGFSFLLMHEKETGELVGHCGLKRVDAKGAPNPGDIEIGWVVREDRWRRGYAREAVMAVLDWAFEVHDAPHVVALTSEANAPSWRFMEALGLDRRADLDFDDPDYPRHENPTKVYAITREQWEQHR